MHSTALRLSAAILFVAASTLAAQASSSCAFITTAQVAAATGVPMQLGATAPTSCVWHSEKGLPNVYITIRDAAGFLTMKSQAQASGGKIKLVPVSGIGDEAYILPTTGGSAPLYLLKGSHYALIMVRSRSGTTQDQTEAIEKSLATQVVTHL